MQIWELKGLSITPTLLPNPYTMGFVVVVVVVIVVCFLPFQQRTRAAITADETLNIRLHVDPEHSS